MNVVKVVQRFESLFQEQDIFLGSLKLSLLTAEMFPHGSDLLKVSPILIHWAQRVENGANTFWTKCQFAYIVAGMREFCNTD